MNDTETIGSGPVASGGLSHPTELRLRSRARPRHYSRTSSPWLILSAVILIGVTATALGWATQAGIAVTATATGKVAPPNRVQTISHPEGGAVMAVHVRVGDHVDAGQVLVELDPATADAEYAQIQSEIVGLRGEILRLQSEMDGNEPDFSSLPKEIALQQKALLEARRAHQASEMAVATGELNASRASIAGAQASLTPLRQRLAGRRELATKGFGSSFQVNEDEARIGELTGRLQEGKANEQRALAKVVTVQNSYHEDVAKSLAEDHGKLSGLEQVLPKFVHRLGTLKIEAPISGIVKSVGVTGPGASVRAGESICEIVPDDAKKLIVAKLPAGDIGHVHPGQEARISLMPADAHFPPMDGIVKTVAPDSAADDKTGQLTYIVEIAPVESAFTSSDHREVYLLMPGLPVSVTIVTGERSVIAALAGPLFLELDTALTER